MTTAHNLRCLAVMFRCNDRNLGHCSTLEDMTEAGMAYTFGLFCSIPKRHWRKRKQMADAIASALNRQADVLEFRYQPTKKGQRP